MNKIYNGSRRSTAADVEYMQRALQLARNGAGHASPNPMVGAVIVADGRIIGEGWHRKCGEAHAEVNAIRSVSEADRHLLEKSAMYVTLEPCSHYGKTPPCAELLIEHNIPCVWVATTDPFPAVAGRGIGMLREAGVEVNVGLLEREARELNRRFFTAHIHQRPWVQLKWAQTSDGYMAAKDADGNGKPIEISTPITRIYMHRQRAMSDAILVGNNTLRTDNPMLTTRLAPGKSPRKLAFSTAGPIAGDDVVVLDVEKSLEENLKGLYLNHNITSLMVEGGAKTLQSFLEQGVADELRIETNPGLRINSGIPAPELSGYPMKLVSNCRIDGNEILRFIIL